MSIAPGDTVILKSGSVAMTVSEVRSNEVRVYWAGDDGGILDAWLPLVVVENTKNPLPPPAPLPGMSR